MHRGSLVPNKGFCFHQPGCSHHYRSRFPTMPHSFVSSLPLLPLLYHTPFNLYNTHTNGLLNYLSLSWVKTGQCESLLFPPTPQPCMSERQHLPKNVSLPFPSSPVISCCCPVECISQGMLLNLSLFSFHFFLNLF